MDKGICLHAINAFHDTYNSKETLCILRSILIDKALLSARLQKRDDTYGFNGPEYISLCDYEKRKLHHKGHPWYTAYDGYIKESLSLMFPKEKLALIYPKIIGICNKRREGIQLMTMLGESEDGRYSDMYDEVQVKDKIPIALMTGITLPLQKMRKPFQSEQKNIDMILEEIEKISELLIKYGYDVPIYDINTLSPLKKEENVKTLVRHYRKKRDLFY